MKEPFCIKEPFHVKEPFCIKEPFHVKEPFYLNEPFHVKKSSKGSSTTHQFEKVP